MSETFIYKFDDLFDPLLQALRNLGGSASIEEMENEVAKVLNLTEDQVNEKQNDTTSKYEYRLSWARYFLKRYGLLETSQRGIYALTNRGKETLTVNKSDVKKKVHEYYISNKKKRENGQFEATDSPVEEILEYRWEEKIIEQLQSISPAGFERLCQRLLRELGFQNVEITGQTNDGGIDGKGLLRLGGVLSFQVIFQAKRYKGSVSPSIVRDFRGAMVGRADKGLIITTGTFTREAKREASRDGAPPIDLMDGNDLAKKLKELGLGVHIELVEKITIDADWFKSI